jgi:hypothetical protein
VPLFFVEWERDLVEVMVVGWGNCVMLGMKADELMIGSWAYDPINKRNCRILALRAGYQNPPIVDDNGNGELESSFSSCDVLQGILLSPEWLRRAGFEDVTMSWYTEPCFEKTINRTTFLYWVTEQSLCWDDVPLRKIEFVHQLQILTFALTGTRLTFDEA